MKGKRTSRHPSLDHLEKVFHKYPDIQAVYLFGSTASGRAHAESDLDLAILPGRSSLRAQKLDLLADLAREGFCNVDLVFLKIQREAYKRRVLLNKG